MPPKRLKRLKRKKGEFPRVDSLADFIVDDEDDEMGYDPSTKGEYFEVDTQPLQRELVTALSDSFNIPYEQISSVISSVFSDIAPHMIDDYFSAKPGDNKWKVGTENKTINKLEPLLLELRGEILKETPTIPKILEACITKAEKKRCLKLYDQMNNVEPYTSEYFPNCCHHIL